MDEMEESSSSRLVRPLPEPYLPLPANTPIAFEWEKRWLKGHEYHHILANRDAYCSAFGFRRFEQKSHPVEIYEQPVSTKRAI